MQDNYQYFICQKKLNDKISTREIEKCPCFVWIGAATIRLGMPPELQSSLIFHYNLKLYDSDKDSYDGTSLKRFVMQVRYA